MQSRMTALDRLRDLVSIGQPPNPGGLMHCIARASFAAQISVVEHRWVTI